MGYRSFDYGFINEQQEMFRRSVRDFLRKECPRTLVREIEANRRHYSRELYSKMADLGWLGLMIPAEYGGSNGDWVDMVIFCEEAGRALLQSPHFTTGVLGGQSILTFGTEEQKQNFLPRVAKGELILTVALTEPDAGSNLTLLTTSTVSRGDKYLINGTKLFISNAHIADYIITVTRAGSGGITLFLVNRDAEGLTCVPLDSLSGERLNEVKFDNVVVPKENMLGEFNKGKGIAKIIDKAKMMTCAEIVGQTQEALDMAVEYSKQRMQFGRLIGSFQALQHKMVNMALLVDKARLLVYYVAWMKSQGLSCPKEEAMMRLVAVEASSYVIGEAIQIHGALGTMKEHDLGLFARRCKAAALNLGYPDSLKEVIAEELGL